MDPGPGRRLRGRSDCNKRVLVWGRRGPGLGPRRRAAGSCRRPAGPCRRPARPSRRAAGSCSCSARPCRCPAGAAHPRLPGRWLSGRPSGRRVRVGLRPPHPTKLRRVARVRIQRTPAGRLASEDIPGVANTGPALRELAIPGAASTGPANTDLPRTWLARTDLASTGRGCGAALGASGLSLNRGCPLGRPASGASPRPRRFHRGWGIKAKSKCRGPASTPPPAGR